jgi:hypothetical protein
MENEEEPEKYLVAVRTPDWHLNFGGYLVKDNEDGTVEVEDCLHRRYFVPTKLVVIAPIGCHCHAMDILSTCHMMPDCPSHQIVEATAGTKSPLTKPLDEYQYNRVMKHYRGV